MRASAWTSGLYRGLALPFSAFVLAGALALAAWLSWNQRRESLAELERTAITNAGVIEQLRLPRSPALADKLATILGLGVAFWQPGEAARASGNWPSEVPIDLGGDRPAPSRLQRHGHYDLALATIPGSADALILARPHGGAGWSALLASTIAPAALMTLSCGALALVLARRIVEPLAVLTRWLPQLRETRAATAAIPAAIGRRRDEIGELARALGETHHRLLDEQQRRLQSERLAALGRVATSLAHEIRNPIAAIRLHADLLTSGHDDPACLQAIRDEADQVGDLVNQWLFVARPAPPEVGSHELGEILREVGRRLAAPLAHARAQLEIECPTPVHVRCDRPRLAQVVRNLLVNAIQAMPDGGPIHARIEAHATTATLSLHDSGTGFSARALRQFGEPFFSEREGGMGIGLTLAREVIRAHHGELDVENAALGGAVVRLQLPRSTHPQPSCRPAAS